MDNKGFQKVFNLLFTALFQQKTIIDKKDLHEGCHVSLANFLDTLIDYPRSKDYAF